MAQDRTAETLNVVNEAVASRLLASKQVFTEAEALLGRVDPAGRILAAILLDQAVETALKTVLSVHGGSPTKPLIFKQLIKQSAVHVASAPAMLAYRDIRNSAQHEGIAPATDQLPPFRDAVLQCLKEAFAACGADFHRFTMAMLVQNEWSRALLDAGVEKADEDPVWSIAASWRAFSWVHACMRVVGAAALGLKMWDSYDPEHGFTSRAQTADGKAQARGEMLSLLALGALGVDMAEHVRFRPIGRSATDAFNAREDDGEALAQVSFVASEAWWAVDSVARMAYRLERQFPQTRLFSAEDTKANAPLAGLIPNTIHVD